MEPGFNMGGAPGPIRDLPAPSGYRQMTPAILELPTVSPKGRLLQRKRVVIGFAIAAGLHVGLALAWWLTPPLRLKAGYGPDRWVQVLSLPKPATIDPATTGGQDSTPPTRVKGEYRRDHPSLSRVPARPPESGPASGN